MIDSQNVHNYIIYSQLIIILMTYISHLHATCHHLISVRLILFSNSFLVSPSPSVCTINTNCWESCKYRKMKHKHNKLYNLWNWPRIYRSWGNIILSDAINCIHTVNSAKNRFAPISRRVFFTRTIVDLRSFIAPWRSVNDTLVT